MTALDELNEHIEDCRRLIRRLESIGDSDGATVEEARLSGLVTAREILGSGDRACVHRVHKADGDDNGKQRWRCVDCGAIA